MLPAPFFFPQNNVTRTHTCLQGTAPAVSPAQQLQGRSPHTSGALLRHGLPCPALPTPALQPFLITSFHGHLGT